MNDAESTLSYWIESTQTAKKSYPPFDIAQKGDKPHFDVAIIGGGITGVLSAYELASAGKSVALFERDELCCGASGRALAKVSYEHGFNYQFILASSGEEHARSYAESNKVGLEHIESLVDQYDVDCDFVKNDNYSFASNEQEHELVQKEYEALKTSNVPAKLIFSSEAPKDVSFQLYSAAVLTDQARFHPRKFVLAMARVCEDLGVRFFEQTTVSELTEGEPCSIELTVQNDTAQVLADDVISATGTPFPGISSVDELCSLWKGQVISVPTQNEQLADSYFKKNGYPGSYRSCADQDGHVMIVGNATADLAHPFNEQEKIAKDLFEAGVSTNRWYGEDCMLPDMLPAIGMASYETKHIYMAAGFCGWGMTKGALAAMMLRDLICNRSSEWEKLYSPTRPALEKGVVFDLDRIKKGQGALYVKSGNQYAVYRDEQGSFHAVSPICTHMGCLVGFDEASKEWHCPCHGSRYDAYGHVIGGPAKEDLAVKKLPQIPGEDA